MAAQPGTSAERLWSRVNRTDRCWEWTGALMQTGYGAIRIGNRTRTTHRVAWELTYGAIPDGMFVCHRCDNRRCCNPSHLFLGTNQDNMRDASAKGRLKGIGRPTLRGERHHQCRLTDKQVVVIRQLWADGHSQAAIARTVGHSPSQINNIVHHRQRILEA
jgi:hypothetical protein